MSDFVAGRRSQEYVHSDCSGSLLGGAAGAAGGATGGAGATQNSSDMFAQQRVGKQPTMTSQSLDAPRVVLDGSCRIFDQIIHVAARLMAPDCKMSMLS